MSQLSSLLCLTISLLSLIPWESMHGLEQTDTLLDTLLDAFTRKCSHSQHLLWACYPDAVLRTLHTLLRLILIVVLQSRHDYPQHTRKQGSDRLNDEPTWVLAGQGWLWGRRAPPLSQDSAPNPAIISRTEDLAALIIHPLPSPVFSLSLPSFPLPTNSSHPNCFGSCCLPFLFSFKTNLLWKVVENPDPNFHTTYLLPPQHWTDMASPKITPGLVITKCSVRIWGLILLGFSEFICSKHPFFLTLHTSDQVLSSSLSSFFLHLTLYFLSTGPLSLLQALTVFHQDHSNSFHLPLYNSCISSRNPTTDIYYLSAHAFIIPLSLPDAKLPHLMCSQGWTRT